MLYRAWSGTIVERAESGTRDLRQGLVAEVRRLATGRPPPRAPVTDMVSFTRHKVGPMVRGLFSGAERDAVLAILEKSVVFLTGANIEPLLQDIDSDGTAWEVANLYLTSIGAKLLGADGRLEEVVGFSENTTCYVSAAYFAETCVFADFVVHETAHIFHNCRRCMIGLPETRTRKCLLEIDYRKREEFAYACEAFSCICERGGDRTGRHELAAEFARKVPYPASAVDVAEVAAMVQEAVVARNGWKTILAHCSPE